MHGGSKGTSCSLKSWGDYLFPDMEDTPEAAHCGVADEDISDRMRKHFQGDLVVKEDDGPYEQGDVLRSFHHQARRPMSRKALLAGFLTVWLKRCVVPSSSMTWFNRMFCCPLFVWFMVVLWDFFRPWCAVSREAFVH